MPLHLLPTLLLYVLLMCYSPGPANIYAMSCAVKYGRKQALGMWRGLLAGFSTMAVITSLAAFFIGEEMEAYVVWLKYLGAAYIIWLAYNIWRKPAEKGVKPVECNFTAGFMVQMMNAKMIVLEFTVYSSFVLPYTHHLTSLLGAAALLVLAGPTANLTWLLAGGWMNRLFERQQRTMDHIMAIALLGCAIMIIV